MPKQHELTQLDTTKGGAVTLSALQAVKNIVAPDATDEELQLFALYCNRTGLDPFSNQIHFIKRGGKATFQTSIDGYRSIAESTGEYQGQTEVVFGPPLRVRLAYRDHSGQRKEVEKEVPTFAKVGVYRKEFKEPLWGIAYWDEYVPAYPNQTMWIKMPRIMLSKCAEALALRKAFPKQLAGVYTSEEMEQAEDQVNLDGTENESTQPQTEPAEVSKPKTKTGDILAETIRSIESAASPDEMTYFKDVFEAKVDISTLSEKQKSWFQRVWNKAKKRLEVAT